MDEIIPGLWIGDLASALDTEALKENNIFSVLSAMRGRITVHETFIRHQIHLDDTEEEDILAHFLPSITFIQSELDKGRGVLVHCQAGMSRSVTIVAAYLMYTKKLDPNQVLDFIRERRPNICPNAGFLGQLEVFYQASFKINRSSKAARMFYMERTLGEVMNGDGTLPETDMFAKFPRTPGDSVPSTPSPAGPRRRIRCKMCRQELAAREHMLDHGQLNPPTPMGQSPATSRRSSSNQQSRRPSFGQRSPLDTRPRRPSVLGTSEPLIMTEAAMETAESTREPPRSENTTPVPPRRTSSSSDPRKALRPFPNLSRGMLESLSMSALEDEEEGEPKPLPEPANDNGIPVVAARAVGRNMSNSVIASANHTPGVEEAPAPTVLASPGDLMAQLFSNPKLAALRSADITPGAASTPTTLPIIANPKCSGYFVEPMKWMEPLLASGQLAGKIMCPNKKCGAKLGNYDWAGVCCSCKQWVTPGFCIHRSKVDEIVV